MLPQTISPQKLVRHIGPGIIVLDVDGTLAPLRLDPQAVRLSLALQKTLARLAGRRPVALVSGRPLAFLHGIAGDLPVLLVGSHGAEANRAGFQVPQLPLTTELVSLKQEVEHHGVTVEMKPYGMALHFRKYPPGEREALRELWRAKLAPRLPPLWELMLGNAVLEIRPHGVNKGLVLEPLRRYAAGPIAAAFGDDMTDEDMFLALRPGEIGVLVGHRRASNAPFLLPGITAVRRCLDTLALAGSGPRHP